MFCWANFFSFAKIIIFVTELTKGNMAAYLHLLFQQMYTDPMITSILRTLMFYLVSFTKSTYAAVSLLLG